MDLAAFEMALNEPCVKDLDMRKMSSSDACACVSSLVRPFPNKLYSFLIQSFSYQCKICMAEQPNIISMEKHYDSKHSKIKFDDALKAEYEAMKNS